MHQASWSLRRNPESGEDVIAPDGNEALPWRSPARRVPVTTVDNELSARGWQDVDFLKIDTEGYDLNVLLGASDLLARKGVKVVQFEYNATWAVRPERPLQQRKRLLLSCAGIDSTFCTLGDLAEPNPRAGRVLLRYSNFM